MNILLLPIWDERFGNGEAYKVILGSNEKKIKNTSTSLHL